MRQQLKVIYQELGPTLFRNVLTLINAIISVVVIFLFAFHEFRDAIFLLSVSILNITIGAVQDLRAKVALEKLQSLVAQKFTRLKKSGGEELVAVENLLAEDTIKIKIGDQVPADCVVIKTSGLEINESLITGESNSVAKVEGDQILGGSAVVAGSALLKLSQSAANSLINRMSKKIKKYSFNPTPIQRSINVFIGYMSYLLLAIVIFVVVRGILVEDLVVNIVKDIAALSGTVVPEGLILATTLLFAYGAIRLFRGQVLLQEINAAEKLGRIKNLCIDKTGTLTENNPVLEAVKVWGNYSTEQITNLFGAYVTATEESSPTIEAIISNLKPTFNGTIEDVIPFSSTRKYGACRVKLAHHSHTIVVGAPDVLLPYITNKAEADFVNQAIDTESKVAKRLILIAESAGKVEAGFLDRHGLKICGIFVLVNPLRPSTREVVSYFQTRGVTIRVISGDNAFTVQAIARLAGIAGADQVITGTTMEGWTKKDYATKAISYNVFARVKPEQKERLIEAFKKTGFTAMIGDGANDALAIKKSDLGIAMFDGASVLRQIAPVILMNNSFASLPGGVALADSIIATIEMVGSVFFNKIITGLSLFVILSFFNHSFPILPRNMTVINYCVIGLPIFYWTLFPVQKKRVTHERLFLHKILPVSITNGLLSGIGIALIYFTSADYYKVRESNILVVIAMMILGIWFFINSAAAFGVEGVQKHLRSFTIMCTGITVFLLTTFFEPFLADFFGLYLPDLWSLLQTFGFIFLIGVAQYYNARYFASREVKSN